jgi:hypothetical protein
MTRWQLISLQNGLRINNFESQTCCNAKRIVPTYSISQTRIDLYLLAKAVILFDSGRLWPLQPGVLHTKTSFDLAKPD